MKDMKNKILTLVIGLLGGIMAIGAYEGLIDEEKKSKIVKNDSSKEETQQEVKYVKTKSGLPEQLNDFSAAAKMTVDAVVHVKTEKTDQSYYQNPFRHFWGQRPKKRRIRSAGSGVIVSKDGYIVTNNHVIEDASKIKIALNNGKTYDAEVVGT
ncbi:MAG: trypsin-like peptidase domain-containing protein, partial [Flavobacteriales bacterium]